MKKETENGSVDGIGAPCGPCRRIRYWLRWLLLVPAMGAAFVFVGMLTALPCLFFDFQRGLPLVGPLCALAWVATAYGVAPSHKTIAALVALLVGGIAAWFLGAMGAFQGGGRHLVFALACAGGMGALLVCVLLGKRRPRRTSAGHVRSGLSISSTIDTFRKHIQKGTRTMKENRSLRDILKAHTWVRVFVFAAVLFAGGYALVALGRGVIDIVPQERRGLYVRLGKYVRTVEPGLHLKIPVIDRIIGVPVTERSGYIKHVDAMTADNVIMKVSLQYTYEVMDPRRYRLEVENPDFIIREFVQGKLRDIVNNITMNDVMKKRMDLGQRVREGITGKGIDYGVRFKLIQIQGAYPPPEVLDAIKQRMVTEQRTVAAREQATQKQILADATFYEAQKQSQAAKYRIEETAKARKESIRMMLEELAVHGSLGQKYVEFLMAQELKDNSKWIITGDRAPQFHLDAGVARP